MMINVFDNLYLENPKGESINSLRIHSNFTGNQNEKDFDKSIFLNEEMLSNTWSMEGRL